MMIRFGHVLSVNNRRVSYAPIASMRGRILLRGTCRNHDCGEEAILPVVNSPRMGVCGYTGG